MATIVINTVIGRGVYFTLNDGIRDYEFHGINGSLPTTDNILLLIRGLMDLLVI